MAYFYPEREHSTPQGRAPHSLARVAVSLLVLSFVFGFAGGVLGDRVSLLFEEEPVPIVVPVSSHEEAVIEVAKASFPAIVSIVVSKDVPVVERIFRDPFEDMFPDNPFDIRIPEYQERGTERREIGGGTGFVVSHDGLILTNKHVVADEEAEYTVFTNDGNSYEAVVVARHPTQDLAILHIETILPKTFPVLTLGDSEDLRIGQTVVAIGNVLGEFRNSVSVGVISGLGRSITASGGNFVQTLEDVIQTDAAINRGNSGGPLLNLSGQVVGMNTAMALQAQNIGFAVPINQAKRSIAQVRELGRIVLPFLGVRYVMITEQVKEELDLPVSQGALIIEGENGESAVLEGSGADLAGIREGDIIVQFNGEEVNRENPLWKLIEREEVGSSIEVTIIRDGQERVLSVELGERPEE